MSRRRARRRFEQPAPPPPPPARPWSERMLWPVALLLVFGAALALYWGSLRHPLVFDDQHLSLDGVMSRYGQDKVAFGVRWLAYVSYPWIHIAFGPEVLWQRLTNALLHGAVALTLFGFLARLFGVVLGDARMRWVALAGALWFTVHPVAVYGVAYLMERSIVLATLFSLVALRCMLEGLVRRSIPWYVAAVAAYALALLCKEHAVMTVAIAAALAALVRGVSFEVARRVGLILAAFALFGTLAALQRRGYFATVYEPFAAEALARAGANLAHVYPLSILNQATLFFRYLLTWIVPWPGWMSVDVRTPFPLQLLSWPYLAGFAAWLAYGAFAAWLLLRRGVAGLAGFGLLFPWLLMIVEFSVVRVQEPFVLYRSYLWMAGLPAAFPALAVLLTPRRAAAAIAVLCVPLALAAHGRVQTFASALALWTDALEKNTDVYVPFAERGYVNRGIVNIESGRLAEGAADIERALEINHRSADAWFARGTMHLRSRKLAEALADYNRAIEIDHVYAAAYHKRCIVKFGLGRVAEALPDCERSILHDPWDEEVYINQGVVLRQLGNLAAAGDSYRKALELAPSNPSAHYNYGVLLLQEGRRDLAVRDHFVVACNARIAEACDVLKRSRVEK